MNDFYVIVGWNILLILVVKGVIELIFDQNEILL